MFLTIDYTDYRVADNFFASFIYRKGSVQRNDHSVHGGREEFAILDVEPYSSSLLGLEKIKFVCERAGASVGQ